MSRFVTKPTKWHVRPTETQISLGICQVWSDPSMSAWKKLRSLATHWAHSEGSERMPRLIWVFAGRTVILLVLSRGGSYSDSCNFYYMNLQYIMFFQLAYIKGVNKELLLAGLALITRCDIYVPHRRGGGHIVFGADPVGVGVSVGVGVGDGVSVTLSCLHDISWTGELI